jgi:hypothetical protein
MGWLGYGLYEGDETQTRHIDFIKMAIPSLHEGHIMPMLGLKKTTIPKEYISSFKAGAPNILKKIKPPKNAFSFNEDKALEWQMLLSLFVDNNIKVPKNVLIYGTLASYFLMGEVASDFDEPAKRRSAIKRFIKKVDENFITVVARKEILKTVREW